MTSSPFGRVMVWLWRSYFRSNQFGRMCSSLNGTELGSTPQMKQQPPWQMSFTNRSVLKKITLPVLSTIEPSCVCNHIRLARLRQKENRVPQSPVLLNTKYRPRRSDFHAMRCALPPANLRRSASFANISCAMWLRCSFNSSIKWMKSCRNPRSRNSWTTRPSVQRSILSSS